MKIYYWNKITLQESIQENGTNCNISTRHAWKQLRKMAEHQYTAESIVNFWFIQCRPWQWFRQSDAFDEEIRSRFGDLVEQAQNGELQEWSSTPRSGLALVLLLDQFSRQIWRNQQRAYAGDPLALTLSCTARALMSSQRRFHCCNPMPMKPPQTSQGEISNCCDGSVAIHIGMHLLVVYPQRRNVCF